MPQPRLFLIDSFGFIFRAYHARARSGAPPMRTSTGLSTEAVFIFNSMLRRLTKVHKPEYIAAIFESTQPTHRLQEFAAYKANRAEAPPDLAEQIPYVRRILEGMRIPVLEYPGFEADDVIGTIARSAAAAGVEVVIVSSDKDMLQLIDDHIKMLNPAKDDQLFDAAAVKQFMGVHPNQVADLLALKGDAVDNIPGAPGIGDKGAKDLIERFGSLDALLERAAEVERKMYRESLQHNVEQIRLSQRLATIATDVPVEFTLASAAAAPVDVEALKQTFKELEFFSLIKELGPSEDTRSRDYQLLETPAALAAWLPANVPVAIAIGDRIGLSVRAGEARAVSLDLARALLEDPARPKIVCDIKTTLLELRQPGVAAHGFAHDVMLYAFLLDADPSGCSLAAQAQRRLDRKLSGGAEAHADLTLELWQHLNPLIDERGLRRLYEDIDLPLTAVLARMERTGIRVDTAELERLSRLLKTEITRLTAEIHALAGRIFNIASPQQLGRILFEDLKLPVPARYRKSKTISTAAEVLDELAGEYEIVRKVLEYRQLVKLKGTYVDALPALIDPFDLRIHTSFNQTGAATGRLSSSNPNLQNIPIKTALGREIRAAFVPEPGWKLLVADYSQIELRFLAHMSRDHLLVEAFRNGEDIHTRTAAEVMGVPPLMVTPEARRGAKAVNFGIVYGISAHGLSKQLGISRLEAQRYIDGYFERYAGVRKFIDATQDEVRRSGIARTLFGRERPIPDINSLNPSIRGSAERIAINSPLQGSAADLIKKAMIRIDRHLQGLRTRMLLQVHDELVLEAPEAEVRQVASMVKHEMEQAAHLEVPLIADVGIGDNWRDCK